LEPSLTISSVLETARLLSREVRSAKEAFSEQVYGLFTGKILVPYEKIEAASI